MLASSLSFFCDPQSYELAVDFAVSTTPSRIELPHLSLINAIKNEVLENDWVTDRTVTQNGSGRTTTKLEIPMAVLKPSLPPAGPIAEVSASLREASLATESQNSFYFNQQIKGKGKEKEITKTESPHNTLSCHSRRGSLEIELIQTAEISRNTQAPPILDPVDPYCKPQMKRIYNNPIPYTWYSSKGADPIAHPPPCPPTVSLKERDLFLHHIVGSEQEPQIWQASGTRSEWDRVLPYQTIRCIHGTNYVVALSVDSTVPSWIKTSSIPKNKRYLMDYLESSISHEY